MENPAEVVSEEEAAAATDATLAGTPTRTASEQEMEPASTETTHQGDLTEQDDDFGDFAAATPSDVVDAKDEQTDLESDLYQNKIEEINDTENVESTLENNGSHIIDGSDRPQVSPPDDLDDPFAHLPTAAASNEAGVGEEVPNDETAVVDNTVLCDSEQEERSTEDNVVQFPMHSSKDSETESKNGIESDNGHVEAVPESEDFGGFETPKENTIIPLVDSEEGQVAPAVDAFDDSFAHLPTGEETSCVSNNADTEEGNAIISDSPRKVSPNNDDEFFSTHPTNDKSENGASESDGVESETGHESSSPENDTGYFSAVTDGDAAEQSNEEDIQMIEPSVPAETMIQESNSTEEMTVNDTDHSGAESKVGTASIIEQPGAETSSSTDIDATVEIIDHSEGDHIDAAVVESDGFGAFERVGETTETQADTTEISDDIATTEVEVVEELDSPGLMKENAVAGEMIAAEGTVDSDDVDDDDFGDFGSFEKADSAPTEASNDLETLDVAPPEDEPVGDDDFGDFGSFEHAETTTSDEPGEALQATGPQAQENDEEEDFGDFGDFTDFSSDTPAQQENSINIRGAAVSSDENTGHPPAQHPPATNLLEHIVNKAAIVFKEVFARENMSSEDDQHASERVVVKVTSSLTELGAADVSEDPSTWLIESISSVMRGVEHLDKSGPTAIVNESSDYPYGHFTVPVCGLPLTKVDISASRRLQKKKSQIGIAFTESQDYSVGASFSADTTESSAEPPPVQHQVAQQSSGTVVSLPPLKSDANTASQNGSGPVDASFADFQSSNDASQSSRSSHASGTESNGKKETLSSSAKQFLQQIPDLSFMLKPTLSLPKKS